MNEALIDLWGRGKEFVDIQTHVIFLFFFAIVMIFTGWWCYNNMIRQETTL